MKLQNLLCYEPRILARWGRSSHFALLDFCLIIYIVLPYQSIGASVAPISVAPHLQGRYHSCHRLPNMTAMKETIIKADRRGRLRNATKLRGGNYYLCAAETCSYAAPNAKSETWNEVSPPEIYQRQKMVSRSKASTPSGAMINLSRNQES